MTCPVCERPYPVPGLARGHLLEHWADYICASMANWSLEARSWLDFGPWLRAQLQLTKELRRKHS